MRHRVDLLRDEQANFGRNVAKLVHRLGKSPPLSSARFETSRDLRVVALLSHLTVLVSATQARMPLAFFDAVCEPSGRGPLISMDARLESAS
jgi:hypothetical protein